MGEKIKITLNVKKETIDKIDELLSYCKIRGLLTNKEFPQNYEEFILGSIDQTIKKLEKLQSLIIEENVLSLKSKNKLKNNFKKIAEDKGYLQKDLCNLTGIDKSNISYILSNRNQPSMDYFLRLWVVLGCPPIEEIFYRDSN